MPTKCLVEILAAIRENPIKGQTRPRPARKKSSPDFSFRLLNMLTPMTKRKKTTKTVISAQCRFMNGSLVRRNRRLFVLYEMPLGIIFICNSYRDGKTFRALHFTTH
jgi:hypothetical protein